jgi:hypothetical protein
VELWRLKNTDTRIVFPIIDADGDPTSHADDNTPDSEWLSWSTSDHAGAAPSFADCTHEYVEIAGGFYYLDVQAAEINADFTLVQCKTALAGCKTQAILIRTYINSNEDLHAHIALIEADTNELQVDNVNGGRTDLLIDSIITDVAAVHVHAQAIIDDLALVHTHVSDCATATAVAAAKTVIDDLHNTDLPAVHTHLELLIDGTNGLAAIKTQVNDIHTDVADIHTDVADIHTDVATATSDIAAVHVHAQTIIDDVAAVHVHAATIEADTNELQVDHVNGGRIDLLIDGIEAHAHAIDIKTTNLPASPAAVGSAMTLADDAITSAKFDESTAFPVKSQDASTTILARAGNKMDIVDAPSSTGVLAIADAFLTRAFGSVTYTGTTRCVLTALQKLRNKVVNSGATQTVYKENDSTASYTATLVTDAGADPVISVDPDS